jgi:hypothetical protein
MDYEGSLCCLIYDYLFTPQMQSLGLRALFVFCFFRLISLSCFAPATFIFLALDVTCLCPAISFSIFICIALT